MRNSTFWGASYALLINAIPTGENHTVEVGRADAASMQARARAGTIVDLEGNENRP